MVAWTAVCEISEAVRYGGLFHFDALKSRDFGKRQVVRRLELWSQAIIDVSEGKRGCSAQADEFSTASAARKPVMAALAGGHFSLVTRL